MNTFPFIFIVSVVGCIAGSLLTPADDEKILKNFYKNVRPWGFWKPIFEKVNAETPGGIQPILLQYDKTNFSVFDLLV